MINWAIREGFDIPGNPVFGTNRPAEPKSRNRVLADSELAEIWASCRNDDYGQIVKFLILTGQRREEVGGMCWAEIDKDKKLWTIPGVANQKSSRTRCSAVRCCTGANNRLPARKIATFSSENGPRRNGDKHRGFSGWSKSKVALDRRILDARKKAALDAGQDAQRSSPSPIGVSMTFAAPLRPLWPIGLEYCRTLLRPSSTA